MYAGIECANSPNRGEPSQHKRPSTRPEREVFNVCEDVTCAVTLGSATNRQSDDGGEDKDEVHDDEDGLQFAHNASQGRGDEGVARDSRQKHDVDDTVGGTPVAVSGDDDNGQEHQGEAV